MTVNLRQLGPVASLDSKLTLTPIPTPLRRSIINGIFDISLTEQQFASAQGFDAYFSDWYEEQSEVAAGHVSITKHCEILDIIARLRKIPSLTRKQIFEGLLQSNPSVDGSRVDASINLAVSLWLTTSVEPVQQSLIFGTTVLWQQGKLGKSLQRALWPNRRLPENVKLPRIFTAANLERIAGLKVIWTSNLADHLSLRDDDTKVLLFHQTSFLELHRNTKQCINKSILPSGLVEETMCTMGLLIPSTDKKSAAWFRQKQKALRLDPRAGTYGPINVEARQTQHFKFWGDRLIILKQTFDEAEPHTLSLWWFDDRKKVQWYTFWVAALVLLLTIVFGLIQSVSGIVQAWAAVRSMPD